MSKRIVFTAAILLLLAQTVSVWACVSMPAQARTTCCCQLDANCAMASRLGACAVPAVCCPQATGSTLALSASTVHPDDRSVALPIARGAPPARDPFALIEQRATLDATQRSHHSSAPPSAVPLYLRHLRLTL